MRNRYWTTAIAIMALIAGSLGAGAARAQDESEEPDQYQDQGQGPSQNQNQNQNEPEPGAARVSMIHGDVSMQRGDTGDWEQATVNAPLVRGDGVAAGERSRAEIQLDYADILRLDQRAEAKIADLTRSRIQVQVAQGRVDFTVLKGGEANVEIDTPNLAVLPQGEGTYGIQVNSNAETEVIVRRGEAEVSTHQGSTTVHQGEMITVEGPIDNAEYKTVRAPGRDEWDQWNNDRDKEIEQAQSWRYTNHYYTGASDLDRYGDWRNVPDYGWCWTPMIDDPYWAPYRVGRWVWEPFYGWTWVSYEPWGWAPYHYGRWFYYGNSWCWWPGAAYSSYYPVWAPAYVSFFGFGFGGRHWFLGFGFGGGLGSIGWMPIGPSDPYFRWWGRGGGWGRGGRWGRGYGGMNLTHINDIRNITDIRNIRNVNGYVPPLGRQGLRNGSNLQAVVTNARVRNGVTAVPPQVFVGQRVPARPQPVSAEQFRQAQAATGGPLPVVPVRQSLQPGARSGSPSAAPQRNLNNQRFFTKSPAPAGPESFNRSSQQIQQALTGRGAPNVAAGGNYNQNAGQRASAQGRPGVTAPAGRPGVAGNEASQARNAQSSRPGWQRFGQPAGTTSSARTGAPSQGGGGTFQRPAPGSGSAARQAAPAAAYGSRAPAPASNGGWQRFTPQSQQALRGTYSRPPLALNRPMLSQRAPSYGGGYGAPRGGGYSAPRGGGYGAPSGGGYSAPRGGGYGAPSGGGYSAPRGGGYGAPRGGGYGAPRGGGYSAPRGGGYSAPHGGGASAPRGGGGGGAPSGGGHSSGGGRSHH